ncbi:invasion associated locus B family protein [Agrobacterium rhizogenes]|uniref:invasion associated locus B family protein n=1 Tax=Rhizobium rhizogenes TaxID=359 RepID=UPI001574E834|nr:invasion associated locus B family protein [Rhizobium rhizogenes]NTG50754.1 invasion associated locus B family protein [Rhizobium rhizogenes]
MAHDSLIGTTFAKRAAFTILLSSVLCTSPTLAQDAGQQPVASGNPPAAGAAATATQSPQAAPPQPAPPPAKVTKFDDWYYRCIDGKAADGSAVSSCEVAQIATVKQGDQDVNVLTLAIAKAPASPNATATAKKGGKAPAADLVLTALVPLNMYLPAGLSIDAGDKQAVQLAYRNCNQAGCWSQQKLDAKALAALQKGADGTGHVQLMNGQKVNIKFSLKGLSAALDELQKPASN